ncbi:calcium-binding protein [Bradyrhizobium nanningense]
MMLGSIRARHGPGSCKMRHMPNDTIFVSVGSQELVLVFGDPGLPVDGRGGNDSMIATVDGGPSTLLLVGDDEDLQGRSHGGNDHFVADVVGFGVYVTVDGDARTMSGHAHGGNDVLNVDATDSIYTSTSLFGDAEMAMTGETRGGNDVITGTMGDRAYGTFVGDAGTTMNDDTRGGNDIINVTQAGVYGAASISGDALIDMSGEARGGNDILIYTIGTEARSGGAFMVGDADYLSDNARGGDDVLVAAVDGNPDSTSIAMFGDASNMSGSAHGGNDILVGSARGDWLYGDAHIYAPAVDGSITGGRDLLNGGGGNDQLWGGPNNDLFVFEAGSGQDLINDFDQGNKAGGSTAPEYDVIDVHAYGFADWAALKSLISDDSVGNAVIQLTANDTITLEGIHAADLTARDFIV